MNKSLTKGQCLVSYVCNVACATTCATCIFIELHGAQGQTQDDQLESIRAPLNRFKPVLIDDNLIKPINVNWILRSRIPSLDQF